MDTTWRIQKAVLEDAECILALHTDTVRRINSKDYLPEQINTWLANQRLGRVRELIAEGKVLVAVDGSGQTIGFIGRVKAEIQGLYVSADHLRKGVGRALLDRLELDAKKEGIGELVAESSLAAEPFYRNCGFVEVEKKQWSLASGISIEVVVMRKIL